MQQFILDKVIAREILDSRGNPTVEVEAVTADGLRALASVPSGASTGKREAHERRDGDAIRYGGKGVLQVVSTVHKEISPTLSGMDIREQRSIDSAMIELDGTEEKSRLGANAVLGVSLAVARLAARSSSQPLYRYLGGLKANLLPVTVAYTHVIRVPIFRSL